MIEDRDISFHLLLADDGSRIRCKRMSAETGEEVDWDQIAKGYEYKDGHYVTFTHEELEQIPFDSLHTTDISQFTSADEIDSLSFERSYYVAPDASGVKAYVLLQKHSRRTSVSPSQGEHPGKGATLWVIAQ